MEDVLALIGALSAVVMIFRLVRTGNLDGLILLVVVAGSPID